MRLGIDVGRTTTAAVLVGPDGATAARAVVASAPSLDHSLHAVLDALDGSPYRTCRVVCLTTDLGRAPYTPSPVAVLRISPPSHPALGPTAHHHGLTRVVDGGSSLTGRPLAPLDRAGIEAFAQEAADASISSFAVCAAGSPARPEPELAAASVIARRLPGARITLSYEIGSPGLRERENAAAANAALGDWAEQLTATAGQVLRARGVTAPLHFARDDAGMVSADYVRRYPVIATVSAAACALRGAALLAGAGRAVVVDASADSVRCAAVTDGELEAGDAGPGPGGLWMDVGRPRLDTLPFGGDDLPGDARQRVDALVAGVLERAPGSTVLYAGGAATHFGGAPDGVFAAAHGAAHADIRVELEQVVVAPGRAELDRLLGLARDQALARVVSAGAAPGGARIARVVHTPVSYLPGGVHRIRVRAVGAPSGATP
ncbi:hydantoinase/oxoprolinase N-terminal domain-containing protein [Streptomyces sp. NPDC055749]